jgi:hypothetical protein
MDIFKCYCTLVDRIANETHIYLGDLVFVNNVPHLVAKWTDAKRRKPAELVRMRADKLVRVDNPRYEYVYEFPVPIPDIGPRIRQ